MDSLALFQCLGPHLTATTLRQFSRITRALLVMTGRITMRGLARWAGQGGSYRTVQRFFSQAMPWAVLLWCFFRQHVHRAEHLYLLAGAEVVVQSRQAHLRPGSVLCQSVRQASARIVRLCPLAGQCPGTALVPDSRRAGRAQRNRESGQPGESARSEATTFH
jgi:hypothetical protein